MLAAVGSQIHLADAANPHASERQVFRFGTRLHHLIYETAPTAHNPWNVIGVLTQICFHATKVELHSDTIIVAGLDAWGAARLRELLDSYEG